MKRITTNRTRNFAREIARAVAWYLANRLPRLARSRCLPAPAPALPAARPPTRAPRTTRHSARAHDPQRRRHCQLQASKLACCSSLQCMHNPLAEASSPSPQAACSGRRRSEAAAPRPTSCSPSFFSSSQTPPLALAAESSERASVGRECRPTSVRELDDDSIALPSRRTLTAWRRRPARAAQRAGAELAPRSTALGDADTTATPTPTGVLKHVCAKFGLTAMPAYAGGPTTWHGRLARCRPR